MQVALLQEIRELDEIRDAWMRLTDQPHLLPDWILTWWKHYGPAIGNCQLFVLAVFDQQQQLLGVAPWYAQNQRLTGTTIRSLASGEVCSDHLSLVCRPNDQMRVANAIADWLLVESEKAQTIQLVQLDDVDCDDPGMNALIQRCRQQRAWIETRSALSTWYVPLPKTWDAYLAQLSKNHRKRCRRWERSYFQTGRAVVKTAESSAQLDAGQAILQRLHDSRRQSLGDEGVFQRQTFQAFHHDVMESFLTTQRLRLAWVELDGQPVAVEYQLLSADTVFAYQSGMDAAAASHSPGSLSVMASIRWAIEQGRSCFDFMRGDESYKTSWGGVPRETQHLRIRPGHWTNAIRHGVSLAGNQTRLWLKAQGSPISP